MHLAFAITEYFPFGGAQRDFIAVANAMAQRGHKITVMTTAWRGDRNPDWQYILFDHKQKTNHGRMQLLSEFVVAQKKKLDFDAVIGFTKMADLDVYFAADNCFVASKFKGLYRLFPRYRTYANIEKTLFANKELKVFYLTDIQRQQYADCYDLDPQNSVLLPVCVDESFRYDEAAWIKARQWRETQTSADKIVLLFVAADFKTKGLDRIISALILLDETEQSRFVLWIIGEGKRARYQSSLNKLTYVDYQFFGGRSELRQFYLAADYLVHPARKEAAGMVLAEAMAARLPICVTDICGYHFLAKDDENSVILNEKNVIPELVLFLKQLTKQSSIVARGQGSEHVLNRSRAEFCADQIEAWLKH